jgi:hypothetical protein
MSRIKLQQENKKVKKHFPTRREMSQMAVFVYISYIIGFKYLFCRAADLPKVVPPTVARED